MALSSNVQKFGAAAMAALSIGVAANDAGAQTQERPVLPSQMGLGECKPMAAVFEGLKEENQLPVILGELSTVSGNSGLTLKRDFIFTTRSDYKYGYVMVTNSNRELCKWNELNNIALFDANSGNGDPSVILNAIDEAGSSQLSTIIRNRSRNLNQTAMYMGMSDRHGQIVTVMGSGSENNSAEGVYIVSDYAGENVTTGTLGNVRYTERGRSLLTNLRSIINPNIN